MTEEPYRWLEAVGNRREYVRDQIKDGSPGFAIRRPDGILLLGVGTGQSKVFEIFDRHGLVALGHPADIEKIRQAAIDAAHMEAFTRAPEDVSLRRLVGFGLGPQLKNGFEQIFSAPFLIQMALAELHDHAERDVLLRLEYDGSFQFEPGSAIVLAGNPDSAAAAQTWLQNQITPESTRAEVVELALQTWWGLTQPKPFAENVPPLEERRSGWRGAIGQKTVEIGWLDRKAIRPARFIPLTLADLALA